MPTQRNIAALLREQQPYLAATYGVKRIGIFGSYAHGSATEDSDVDLVLEFDRPIGFMFVELGEYLERVLDKKVDILTQDGIQAIRSRRIADAITGSIVYV